jgi:peptidyl-prolyl cis-trans isomerase B (cyclophilin B)
MTIASASPAFLHDAMTADVCRHILAATGRQGYNERKRKVTEVAMSNPVVTIQMKDGGIMKAELYPDVAPNTVNNFISLIKKGFYNGLIFHRVIPGFMIQGGCPDGTGMGGPGYEIKGEFTSNGFTNKLKHTEGVLSMARSMDPDSAGSQFFIMHKDAPHLDGSYAAFGKITEGMDVVDKIAGTDTDYSDRPKTDQVIEKMTVETFGTDYPEPKKA